jgi:molybdopterin synthase sulfur carrier subunit
MAVRVVFLGPLRELAGADELALDAPLDLARLLQSLNPALGAEVCGARVKLAVNGALLADKTALAAVDGDEVALLPPVSGG